MTRLAAFGLGVPGCLYNSEFSLVVINFFVG